MLFNGFRAIIDAGVYGSRLKAGTTAWDYRRHTSAFPRRESFAGAANSLTLFGIDVCRAIAFGKPSPASGTRPGMTSFREKASMRIAVVGADGVGGGFGAALAQAGADVT